MAQDNSIRLDPVMPLPAVRAALGIGPTSVYKLVKLGLLARPVKMKGLDRTGWRASDVKSYLDSLEPSPSCGSAKTAPVAKHQAVAS